MSALFWIVLFVFILSVIFVVAIYNGLVRLRNESKNAFSQIDVQLQKRHDLVPNLVETAKAYLKHEKETLTAVIEARNHASQSLEKTKQGQAGVGQLQSAENTLQSSLGRLMLVVEQYPELKANAQMLKLTEDLNHIEQRVAFARQAYNDSVMHYHNALEVFPNTLLAAPMGFRSMELFEISNLEHRSAPKVSF